MDEDNQTAVGASSVVVLQQQQHQQQQQTRTTMSIRHALEQATASSCSTHNVMGVVVKISVDVVNSRAQVLLADPSIPMDSYARFSLSGRLVSSSSSSSSSVAPLFAAEVSVGDVMYFHGFRMHKRGRGGGDHGSAAANNHHPHGLMVADFFSTWQEPDAGWNVLYRRRAQNDGDDGQPQVVSCNDDQATTRLVRDLVEWSIATKRVDASIPAIPCRRRRLTELLHTAVGSTSHVVAKVVSVDAVVTPPPPTSGSRAKRKRWLPLQKKRRSIVAVLADDGNEVMPLLDCAVHEAALKTANQSGCDVLLTNIVTCAASAGQDKSDRDIVLRPTNGTSVVPMLKVATEPSVPDGASSNHSDTQQCLLSLTQEMRGTSYSAVNNTAVATETLSSPLRDVFIDDLNISLGDGNFFVSPNGFVSAIIDNRPTVERTANARYREATLTLDDGMVAKANSEMMKILCGSMEPQSILDNARLRGHVTELMRGLLEENIVLTWTLQRQGDVYHATRCVLPRF